MAGYVCTAYREGLRQAEKDLRRHGSRLKNGWICLYGLPGGSQASKKGPPQA